MLANWSRGSVATISLCCRYKREDWLSAPLHCRNAWERHLSMERETRRKKGTERRERDTQRPSLHLALTFVPYPDCIQIWLIRIPFMPGIKNAYPCWKGIAFSLMRHLWMPGVNGDREADFSLFLYKIFLGFFWTWQTYSFLSRIFSSLIFFPPPTVHLCCPDHRDRQAHRQI